MTVKHHPGDELILGYATGALDEATSLLVATHIALCPQCRHALSVAEEIGGTLMEAEEPAEVAESELSALFDRIDNAPAQQKRPVLRLSGRAREPILPQPLRDYVGGDAGDLRWRSLGGGVQHFPIDTGGGKAKARLLRIPPSSSVPDHSHHGSELTMVLTGSFYDEGAWFRRGDVEEADANVHHQPVAGPEEACVCLAVTDAPLRFRGLIPRLVQPFLGI